MLQLAGAALSDGAWPSGGQNRSLYYVYNLYTRVNSSITVTLSRAWIVQGDHARAATWHMQNRIAKMKQRQAFDPSGIFGPCTSHVHGNMNTCMCHAHKLHVTIHVIVNMKSETENVFIVRMATLEVQPLHAHLLHELHAT